MGPSHQGTQLWQSLTQDCVVLGGRGVLILCQPPERGPGGGWAGGVHIQGQQSLTGVWGQRRAVQ